MEGLLHEPPVPGGGGFGGAGPQVGWVQPADQTPGARFVRMGNSSHTIPWFARQPDKRDN